MAINIANCKHCNTPPCMVNTADRQDYAPHYVFACADPKCPGSKKSAGGSPEEALEQWNTLMLAD